MRELHRTSDQISFDQFCQKILDLAAPLPKVQKPVGGQRRPIQVLKILDLVEVTRLKQTGVVAGHVASGWIFPSTEEAARALGYAPATLTVMFYRARKASVTGLDQDIEVRGYLIGFVDKSRSYRKVEKNVP